MRKKLSALILVVCIVMGTLVTSASAYSYYTPININTTTYPSGTLQQGSPFYFRGTISSTSNIVSVMVAVVDYSTMTAVQSKTVFPNKRSVDILNDGLDSLKFGSLPRGEYFLYLQVQDANGYEENWSADFMIGISQPSTLRFFTADHNLPSGYLTYGNPFYLRGSVRSDALITSARVRIINSNTGSVVQERSVYPNKYTVDFLADGLDSLKFGQLPRGNYQFNIDAWDSYGRYTELSRYFTIT